MHTHVPFLKYLRTLTFVSGQNDDGALSRVAVPRHVVDTTVFLVKPLVLGDARLCGSWCLVLTHVAGLALGNYSDDSESSAEENEVGE